MATRVTDGCRPRFARLAASPLPRACIAFTKSGEKERLLAVYIDTNLFFKGYAILHEWFKDKNQFHQLY